MFFLSFLDWVWVSSRSEEFICTITCFFVYYLVCKSQRSVILYNQENTSSDFNVILLDTISIDYYLIKVYYMPNLAVYL